MGEMKGLLSFLCLHGFECLSMQGLWGPLGKHFLSVSLETHCSKPSVSRATGQQENHRSPTQAFVLLVGSGNDSSGPRLRL